MDNILTVVIVTFNPNYDTLNRCIKSIDNNIEILIIDNAKNLNKSKINNFTDKELLLKTMKIWAMAMALIKVLIIQKLNLFFTWM